MGVRWAPFARPALRVFSAILLRPPAGEAFRQPVRLGAGQRGRPRGLFFRRQFRAAPGEAVKQPGHHAASESCLSRQSCMNWRTRRRV